MARHNRKQQGATLVAVLMALMMVAMSVVGLVAQQITHQHELISLEHRRLERQLATESLFESLAQNYHSEIGGWQGLGEEPIVMKPITDDLYQLQTDRERTDCPHPFETDSTCWRLRVQQASTGFVRERLLVVPGQQCAQPYWYAPAARVGGHVNTDPLPEPTPPLPPVRPPRDGHF